MKQGKSPQEQIVSIMQRIYEQGMTTTSGGNLSIRDANGDVYITPGGTDKGCMTIDDIVCIHKDGSITGKHKPSSEYPFHLKIYEARTDIKAILHAHPPAMVAYSIVRKLPEVNMFPAMGERTGKVVMAEYGLTGSDELGEKIAKAFKEGGQVAELENHGLVVGSEDLLKAYHIFEAMDFCARIGIGASGEKESDAVALREDRIIHPGVNAVEEDKEEICFTEEEQTLCETLCEMVKRAYHQKLLYSALGIFSVRAESGKIFYIPQGIDQNGVEISDVKQLNENKEYGIGWESLHQRIYEMHPDIHSIVTAYPPELMSFAIRGKKFSSRIIPEIYMVMQDVVSIPVIDQKVEHIASVFEGRTSVAILDHTGVVVTAPNLLKAFDRLEVAEYSARAILDGEKLGTIVQITENQLEDIRIQCHLN